LCIQNAKLALQNTLVIGSTSPLLSFSFTFYFNYLPIIESSSKISKVSYSMAAWQMQCFASSGNLSPIIWQLIGNSYNSFFTIES